MRRLLALAAAAAAIVLPTHALAQLRVGFYNVAHLQGDLGTIQAVLEAMHDDDKPGFAVPVDVFIFTEVRQADVATLQSLVNAAAPPGSSYALGTFTTSGTEDSASGANAIFLRNGRVSEVASGHADLATGASRKTDRWLVALAGYPASARFYVYGSHLKASTGSANEQDRLAGVQVIRADADAFGPGTPIIYVGDYNFYKAAEPGYQAFIAAGNGQAVDPIPGEWTGASNAWKHSQSPRDVSGGLTGGGMDDRFDLAISSGTLNDGAGMSFMSGCYRALGNDGNHYNLAINAGNNTYYPSELARSNALADNLYDSSDHVPLLVDYQLPASQTAWIHAQPGKVIRFAPVQVEARVRNDADAVVPDGADQLDFIASGSGSVSGSVPGSAPLAPGTASALLSVATNVVGPIAGSVLVTCTSESAANASISLPVSGQVVRSSNASWSSTLNVDVTTQTFQASSGAPVQLQVPIWNFGWDANQALLDLDSVTPGAGTAAITFAGGLASGIGAVPGSLAFTFNPSGLTPGSWSRTFAVGVSDENIPGASPSTLTLTVQVQLAGNTPWDVNADGAVDGADLGLVIAAWGTAGGPADVDGSGVVDGADIGLVIAHWGTP